MKKVIVSFLAVMSITVTANVYAQQQKNRFVDLWSLRVNAADFLCTVPNAGFEVDLSRSPYNRLSFGTNLRYRWDLHENNPSYNVFELFEVRPELKYWWRFRKVSKNAWYAGLYGNVGNYSLKFSEYGKDGAMLGGGAMIGFARPLYRYRKFAIDLELGLSAGVLAANYDAYKYLSSQEVYVNAPDKSKSRYILPYPVIPELRVAFVFRTLSVENKYSKTNQARIIRRQERQNNSR